jgi:hypothetical protein
MSENFSLGERELSEVLKAVKNRRIEFTNDGLMVIRNDFSIGGAFNARILRDETVQRAIDDNDPEFEAWARQQALAGHGKYFELNAECSPNLIPDAAIHNILDVYFGAASKTSTWYVGCFTSNWTPSAGALSNWAGASSGPLATELPNASYTESNRQIALFGTATSKKISTSSAATFTLATGVSGVTLYGATLNSTATVAYNATDQRLAAATSFATAKAGLSAGDKAEISYEVAGSST